jgi:predicted  nucleic acid-binding Zn-ribbon protein
MANATETDIQQFKDLITAGNIATQKQIADLALSSQQQIAKLEQHMEVGFANIETKFANIETKFANIETKFTKLEGDIENRFTKLEGNIENRFTKIEGDIATLSSGVQNFEKRISEMKIDQRAQDQRFFGLSIFIVTFAAGIAAKLAKLY